MQYRMEQHFRNIYANFRKLSSGSFLSAFKFAPECLKFLVEWFAFRKRFRKVWELFWENTVPIAAVSKVS